ncbi:MAG: outer membrane lipoprotein-sorting protein [Thermodesulfobacteriota bacterium]
MKITAILLSGILLLWGSSAQCEELTGRQIMEMQQKRHTVKSETATVVVLLVDDKGGRKQRLMRRYGKELPDGIRRALLVFTEPRDIAGTALLTWELEGGEKKQWLYLPGQEKMQRIADQSKKSYFMGTDFTYEDLEPDVIDNYNYTLTGSEKVGDADCYVVAAVPATREGQRKSAYGKRIAWVRKDIFFPLKIEFFDPRGRLLKVQTNHDLINLEGTVWTAKKYMMANNRPDHKTVMGLRDQKINIPIGDDIFTERFVLSGKLLR